MSFNRFHPILDLRLHQFDGSDRSGNLEDILLERGFKIPSRCFGKTLIVFLEHADEPIKLIDSPLIGLRYV